MNRTLGGFSAGLLLIGSALLGAEPGRARCATDVAVTDVLDELASHRLELLGEQHRRKEFHDFLAALVRDPRFGERVNDVVVEFGNARFQGLMDRWIGGQDVPEPQLRQVWQDTTQLLVWDSPLYEAFFRSIRQRNKQLPANRRIRVLLGDPPIDWRTVHDTAGYARFAERDETFADVVAREVVSRGRSAILIVGGEHVLRTPSAEPLPTHAGVGDLLTRRFPGMTSVIYTVPPKRPLSGYADCFPVLLPASGEVGGRSFVELLQPGLKVQRTVNGKKTWVPMEEVQWPPVRDKLDALLWLGPDETLIPEPPAVRESRDYMLEIHRRAKIMSDFFGFDLTSDLPPVPSAITK